jgi:hypothetical protein
MNGCPHGSFVFNTFHRPFAINDSKPLGHFPNIPQNSSEAIAIFSASTIERATIDSLSERNAFLFKRITAAVKTANTPNKNNACILPVIIKPQ